MGKIKISWFHLRKTCDADRNFSIDKAEQAAKITGTEVLAWMDNRDKKKAKGIRKPWQGKLQAAWKIVDPNKAKVKRK